MRYTKSFLHKIERLFHELKYTVRYEKGNFQSGYCWVQNRKIVIINRFFDTEARIHCLIDILLQIREDHSELNSEHKDLFLELTQSSADLEFFQDENQII